MEQMQGMDASFVALDQPNTPMHIGSILIYDPSTAPGGFVRFKDILGFVQARLKLSKTMRQRMVKVPFNIDYPYWVEDPNFDLEYHIRHVALPKPGDWRQLCILSARVFSRPLDLTRPPWEILVIEGLDNVEGVPKGSFAMITKVHHSAIDGMSGIDMMYALHTLTPDTSVPAEPDTWKSDRIPNQFRLFARGYARGFINPLRQFNAVRKSTPGMLRAAKGLIKREFDLNPMLKTPKTRFNNAVSPARVVEGQTFPLAGIKAIRVLSPGCKVNDVMLAIVGGTLNRYLGAHNELPDTSMTAMAPISVRSDDEKNSMGNQVSAMFVPLGSHIDDPVERLVYVHENTVKSKAMTNAMGARNLTEISKVSPNFYMGLAARLYSQLGLANRVKPIFNTVVTNVPGPPVPIYSSGAKTVNLFGMFCCFDGVGLGHVVQSYVDLATITITADRKMMPDPEFYSQCLKEAYEELADAAGYVPEPKQEKLATAKRKTARRKTAKPAATKKPTARKSPARTRKTKVS